MAIRSKAASPSKQVAQHGSVLAGGVGGEPFLHASHHPVKSTFILLTRHENTPSLETWWYQSIV